MRYIGILSKYTESQILSYVRVTILNTFPPMDYNRDSNMKALKRRGLLITGLHPKP